MDGDRISTLPIDENEKLPENDQQLLDLLLEDKKEELKEAKKVSFVFKESLLGGLLFLVLSHSYFDKLVRTCGCKSELMVLLLKFAIFVVIFFILQNKFFLKKNN
jgi:uncharacterized membrane protein